MQKNNTLVEIKKKQTGTGLLLENDGYMDLSMKENAMLKESVESFKSGDLNELPRPFVVSAVLQKYGIENANGRIYPEDVLKREVEKYQTAIKERRAFGECNHPESSVIDVERICMDIIEMHWIGRTLIGKVEIPITEGFRKYGICSTLADTVAQLLVSGIRIGVSSRALGSVERRADGVLIVGSDLEILAFDVVATPSTPGANLVMQDADLQPFIQESDTTQTGKKINENATEQNSKFSRFAEWLKD